jgi:hypothetical protein
VPVSSYIVVILWRALADRSRVHGGFGAVLGGVGSLTGDFPSDFRYQPSLAAEFWYATAHDEGLVTGQPEKALLSWLRNSVAAGGQSAQREHCRATALAWNAAFKGREIQYVKPNQMAAFCLLGTPWANGLGA